MSRLVALDPRDWFSRVVLHLRSALGKGEAGNRSPTAKQILVFGSAGTGKTSFINNLTGGNLPTGDGAVGVTLESTEVSIDRDGVEYLFIDTVGLNEAESGGVSGKEAVTALVKLLRRTEGGLNLMVMVVQKGRILAPTLDNYKLFVETMTHNKVPLLVIVTNCEREEGDMQGWVDANRADFSSRGIKAKGIIATTFATPNPDVDNEEALKGKVGQSVDLSWAAIQEHSTSKRVDFMKQSGGFLRIARKMYNSLVNYFARLVGSSSAMYMWVSKDYVKLIQQAGNIDDRKVAAKAAKETVAV
eukprot:g17373.t1